MCENFAANERRMEMPTPPAPGGGGINEEAEMMRVVAGACAQVFRVVLGAARFLPKHNIAGCKQAVGHLAFTLGGVARVGGRSKKHLSIPSRDSEAASEARVVKGGPPVKGEAS